MVGAAQGSGGSAVRVMVTGAAGQLGRELVAVLEAAGYHEVIQAVRPAFDLTDRDSVLGAICSTAPALILHAGAFTAVDLCETETDHAYQVNSLGSRYVADGARRVGAHVVYVSTDYVFDGTKPTPYVEWDTPSPVSVYGRSKFGGELEMDPAWTIARVSWVCGFHGGNMVKTVLRLAEGPGPLRFVDDQRGHPTFADDLAGMLVRLGTDRRPGIHHVTNQGEVSWYEFAAEVLRAAGDDPSRVEPIATADLQPARPAPRPANSVLDNAALRLGGVPLLADFREPLHRLVKRLQDA
ncbi:MAG: dTDP-4-dehydrorhamnose reductase [Acidimicrobiia bacterium]|nr:dTDP-4-dehydrorhamnose reductase [Acidimicrobiia bacterium]